jgi:ATP-binding cassette subfamily B protein
VRTGRAKSTLAKLIIAILLADKGHVRRDDADLADADRDAVWSRTALVPQNFACWPLRARESVTLGQPKTFSRARITFEAENGTRPGPCLGHVGRHG